MPRKKSPSQRPDDGWSFHDVVGLTGATASELTHWTRLGFLRADVAETAGRGHHRLFSTLNLIEANVGSLINRFHVPPVLIGHGMRAVRFAHEIARAVWSSPDVGDDEPLSDAERSQVIAAYVRDMRRRDVVLQKRPRSIEFYTRALESQERLFAEWHQRKLRIHARMWHRFTTDPAYRTEQYAHFLIVVPDLDGDPVADVERAPIDAHVGLEHHALVINLEPVFSRLWKVTDLWR